MYAILCTNYRQLSDGTKSSFVAIYTKQMTKYDGTATSEIQPRQIWEQWESLILSINHQFRDDCSRHDNGLKKLFYLRHIQIPCPTNGFDDVE